ncbi:MAG TPA: Flp pilus assembly protein CpaB [Polyangiaceae bacterium]|nr:Flp pilus assembly protein CpaB [Polyangiaceae bacterium]
MDRRALQIALTCATLATLLLVLYLRRYERELSGGERVAVLALRKSLARGELLSDEALAVREIPMAYLEGRAVRATERSKVLGLPVAAPLEPAQGLLWSDLAIAGQTRDLSSLVQPGKRAVTVLARGNFDGRDHALVHPGDYVDVLVTLDDGESRRGDRRGSRVLLQRVLVLAVGEQTVAGVDPNAHSGSKPLTLSLDIQQAQKLSLAIDRGVISVVLRNPEDALILENPPRVSAWMLSGDAPVEVPAPSAQPVNLGDIR